MYESLSLGVNSPHSFRTLAVSFVQTAAAEEGIEVFDDEQAWDVLEEIPEDSAAALLLIEHHWAVPLRDAIARAGGFRLADAFISPLDLVGIGLVTAAEAAELDQLERAR